MADEQEVEAVLAETWSGMSKQAQGIVTRLFVLILFTGFCAGLLVGGMFVSLVS